MSGKTGLWRAAALGCLAIYMLVLGFNALTRTQAYDELDPMNYVDVARNIVAGRGISQSTLGFNQPHISDSDSIPTPLSHQSPLFPVTMAVVSYTGLSAESAGIVVALLGYAFILFAGYRLAWYLLGEREALVAVLLLAAYPPLRDFSQSSWSEPLGLALMFGSFLLLVRPAATSAEWVRHSLLAGFVGGCAFATKYALAPAVVVGAWFLFTESPRRLRDLAMYGLGAAIPVAAIVARNFVILHGDIMPRYLPSLLGYKANIWFTFDTLTGQYTRALPGPQQLKLLLGVLAVLAVLALVRRRLITSIAAVLTGRAARLLTVFAVVFIVFLVYQRSHSHIDDINPRLLLPASLSLLILASAFIVRASEIHTGLLRAIAGVVFVALIAWQVKVAAQTPVFSVDKIVTESERLSWLAANTTASDLVIGEEAVDVPFYLDRPAAISYSPYPFTEVLEYDKLMALCRKFQPMYPRVFLALRAHLPGDDTLVDQFGAFIAEAGEGKLNAYPGVSQVAALKDGRILRVSCQP